MKIVKETSRRVMALEEYHGVCDGCGVNLNYDEKLVFVEMEYSEERILLVPIDILSCPSCYKTIGTITLYPPMEISKELDKL